MTLTPRQTLEVCSRVSARDQRFAKPNRAVVEAWHEHLAKYRLEMHHAIEAVDRYYDTPRDRVIQIGDVVQQAREIRKRDTEVEESRAITAARPALNPTHPGGLDATGTPIPAAYDTDGAIRVDCPKCGAQPRHYCHTEQRPIRIPHLSRVLFARKATNGATK